MPKIKNPSLKNILFLSTGGTIAAGLRGDGLVPVLDAGDLLTFVPELKSICNINHLSILNLDSSNMQPEEWKHIALEVFKGLKKYDGIVISHGTDTMAYTSSMLSFMLVGLDKPVILTGSQLPITEKGTDARDNLRLAFMAAVQDIQGVFVAFGGRIIRGVRAVKVRTTSFDAFESINAEYVGYAINDSVEINRMEAAKTVTPGTSGTNLTDAAPLVLDDSFDPDVFLLKLIPGTRPEFFDCFRMMGFKGLVIEAFGLGGIHYLRRNLVEKLNDLLKQGISIVVVSQCLYEPSDLTVYEVGRKAAREGIIPGYDMTTEAAVTKLMWVLGHTRDQGEVRRMMLENYCGELNIPKKT